MILLQACCLCKQLVFSYFGYALSESHLVPVAGIAMDPDFNIQGAVSPAVIGNTQGTKRNWLRVYETLPCQLLNGYGQAKYVKISDKEI